MFPADSVAVYFCVAAIFAVAHVVSAQQGSAARLKPVEDNRSSALRKLTAADFTSFVNAEDLVIVLFHSNNGESRRIEHELNLAAVEVLTKSSSSSAAPPGGPLIPKFAQIDATASSAERQLAKRFGVFELPGLKVFRRGRPYDYKNDLMNKAGMVMYAQSLVAPSSKEVSVSLVVKQLSRSDLVPLLIVAFFDNGGPSMAVFQAYKAATEELRSDFRFMHVFDGKGAKKEFKLDTPCLAIFIVGRFQTPYEPKRHVLPLERKTTPEEIVDFIERHNKPLVGFYGQLTKHRVYNKCRPLVLFFYSAESPAQEKVIESLRVKIAKVASKFQTEITFAMADETEEDQLYSNFRFDDFNVEPILNVGILSVGDVKYAMEPKSGEFSIDRLFDFVNSYKTGLLRPIKGFRSQPLPAKPSTSDDEAKQGNGQEVVTVVSANFDDVVLNDNSKYDLLIAFHTAKTRPTCRKNVPKKLTSDDVSEILLEVASRSQTAAPGDDGSSGLIVATMNIDYNDVPNSRYSDHPAVAAILKPSSAAAKGTECIRSGVLFAPTGNRRTPTAYDQVVNELSVDALVDFVEQQRQLAAEQNSNARQQAVKEEL